MIHLISVNTVKLLQGYDSLKAVYSTLLRQAYELSDVQSALARMSGLGGAARTLNRSSDELGLLAEQCRGLYRSLDVICQYYSACENRVLDRGENAVMRYAQPAAVFSDLTAAGQVLQEFSFSMEE